MTSFLKKVEAATKSSYHIFEVKAVNPKYPLTASNCLLIMDGKPIRCCQSFSFAVDLDKNQIGKVKLEIVGKVDMKGQIATEISSTSYNVNDDPLEAGSVFEEWLPHQVTSTEVTPFTGKPIEHFKDDQWSIQTELTHGVPGLVKISKTELEDPKLAMQQGRRMAGAEDLFKGSKQAVMEYAKKTYQNAKTLKFV